MTPADGPAPALLIALLILGVVALLAASAFLASRRARGARTVEAPPEPAPRVPEPQAPPPEAEAPSTPEGPAPAPVEAPAAPPTETPPPVAEAPPTAEVVPATAEPPVAEQVTPVAEQVRPVLEATPSVEATSSPVEAPRRARARPIGALRRLFRGGALSQAEWDELEETLLRADVGVAATSRIVASLRARKDLGDGGLAALRSELIGVLGAADRTLARKGDGLSVWLITGVNGSGKTTTIGKLAAQLRDDGAQVVLAAADTFRAAADQQLETWAERAGAQVVKHSPGADPAAVVFDGVAAAKARGADVLIVDTAGRLQNKRNLMDELSKIRKVLDREVGAPDETLLVIDATTGQNGLSQARAFTEAATLTGIALTKLDGTAKGGIVIAVQQEMGIPVKLVGLGESIEDLAPFDPETFVDDLLAEG